MKQAPHSSFISPLTVWHSVDIWQRVYAAKSDRVVMWGMILSGLFVLVIGFGITLVAYSVRVALPGIDPSHAFIYGMQNLLSPGVLGLGIILVFAAIMSSIDSIAFVLGSSFAKDGITCLKKRQLTSDELRYFTRIGIVLVILLSALSAYFLRSVIDATLILAGFGMALTPAILGTFKWKLKPNAIIISVSAGFVYAIAWIIAGVILPETMISTVLVSAAVLVVFQKSLR